MAYYLGGGPPKFPLLLGRTPNAYTEGHSTRPSGVISKKALRNIIVLRLSYNPSTFRHVNTREALCNLKTKKCHFYRFDAVFRHLVEASRIRINVGPDFTD